MFPCFPNQHFCYNGKFELVNTIVITCRNTVITLKSPSPLLRKLFLKQKKHYKKPKLLLTIDVSNFFTFKTSNSYVIYRLLAKSQLKLSAFCSLKKCKFVSGQIVISLQKLFIFRVICLAFCLKLALIVYIAVVYVKKMCKAGYF